MLFLLRLTEEYMYVFDSPKDGSIKDSERIGRTDAEKPPIGLDEVKMHEPIPKDMEYFWPLNDNKTKLQVLMYDTITQHASENGSYTDIVLGSIQDNRLATKVIDKIVHNVPELNSPYEEADVSLVLHAAEAAKAGAKRLVLLSADTDIRVLKLYYWREFGRKDLNELWFSWLQAIERYIPIHKLAVKLGADFCKVLPAVHALTGCDYSSKTGTKAVVLKANPVSEVFRIILDPNVCFQSTGSKC